VVEGAMIPEAARKHVYYEEKDIVLLHGDCLEMLPLFEPNSIDLVLTDPPYGLNLSTDNSSRVHRPYDKKCGANTYPPVIGDDRPFDPSPLLIFDDLILWGGNHYASRLPDSHFWLAWDRKDSKAADSNITDMELAWVRGLTHVTVRVFRHMWAGFQRDSEVGFHVHPTQKPIKLLEWCLEWFPMSNIILDPFLGSGTTAVACKQLGRKCIGIEIEARYLDIAIERLRQEVLF
jgi:site-specific DNA-methyltransferase (adenine-specific)/modification methylase